jgi:hypothetical protein
MASRGEAVKTDGTEVEGDALAAFVLHMQKRVEMISE